MRAVETFLGQDHKQIDLFISPKIKKG